ncbi:MAG: LCP family protein [Anaerolineales bacterium]|jgi:LCP family protein required for cell wall assembly
MVKKIHLPWRWMLLVLLASLMIVLAGCGQASAGFYLPGALPFQGTLVTANPNATQTATPFSPLSPTATPDVANPFELTLVPTPTSIDPWGNFTPPREPSAIEIRRPMDPIDQSDNTVNILLMGSDQRPYEYGHRTDVMMLVSLNSDTGAVTLLSFPRDLYVFIPGWRVDRINVADAYGGPEMVAETILYNFGLEVDFWARINFTGFMTAVNLLGGIDVQVTGTLFDECGGVHYAYRPGTYHMDGMTALCYVRMRKTSSDFDRLRRQQEVITAIFKRILTLDGLSRVPDLYRQFSNLIQTNMELDDVLLFIPLARQLASDDSRIKRLAIDPTMASGWRVPYSGAAVLLPDWEKIEAMLRVNLEE